jgi:hypothetical protein
MSYHPAGRTSCCHPHLLLGTFILDYGQPLTVSCFLYFYERSHLWFTGLYALLRQLFRALRQYSVVTLSI